MKSLNRRALLLASIGLASTSLMLAGCTTTKDGSNTLITLNVAKIVAYGQAGLTAAATIESALKMFPSLEAYVTPLQVATDALQATLASFTTQAGAQVTIVYNSATWGSIVDSILDAIQKIATLIESVAIAAAKSGLGISAEDVNHLDLVYNALSTIVSVFRALITTTVSSMDSSHVLGVTPAPVKLAMTEAQALTILRA